MVKDTCEQQLKAAVETTIGRLIAATDVPGIALAVVRAGRLERTICCGVRDVRLPLTVDEDTVFDAASLSKPVFAHVVLQLVDQGALSLDAPLADYLPGYMVADERALSITARQVLSHSAGLPNWRNDDLPLKTYFAPGERFSYSGEGFLYLQKATEALTREKLHDLAARLVLQPFGMARSSFVWDWRFDQNRATPHDDFGRPRVSWKPGEGNAASTLQTTAADYARFLLRVIDGSRLQPETSRLWLQPHIEVRHAGYVSLEPGATDLSTGVAWGLGWGLEPSAGTFFHWGDNGAFKAFTVGSVQSQEALVLFTNGASGLALMPEIISTSMPGTRPSLTWLDYGHHDAPVRRLLRAARMRGAAATWRDIEGAGLDVDDQLWIARGLIAAGLDEDGLWLRRQIEQAIGNGPPQRR
jgi:CubicO group peptidase (beta-lactamase class C family)